MLGAYQPQAFSPREVRVAFAQGVSVFPKWLARGLTVQRRSRVTARPGCCPEIRRLRSPAT